MLPQSDENAKSVHPDEHPTSQTLNPLQPIDIATVFHRRNVDLITQSNTTASDGSNTDLSAKTEEVDFYEES